MPPAAPLSAIVVACNRAGTIETCLAALGFADEVLVVDKSSTDGTAERALAFADRVIRAPFSPTVEETRAFAIAAAAHEWVLLLDDDECLDPAAVRWIATELAAPRAAIYALPLRHYILGFHEPAAYYWPEWHPRLFRRDAMALTDTVHRGLRPLAPIHQVPPESGAVIHHLSHRSVHEWFAKTNRYTSRPDRARAGLVEADPVAFARDAIARWTEVEGGAEGESARVLGLLRASYDIVDRLKTWEEERGLDGEAAFAAIQARLRAGYAALPELARRKRAARIEGEPVPIAARLPDEPARLAIASRAMLAGLRAETAALRVALAEERAEAARHAAALDAKRMAAEARAERAWEALRAMQASTIWRATGPLRRALDAMRRQAEGGSPATGAWPSAVNSAATSAIAASSAAASVPLATMATPLPDGR